jgi:hypothetical protein
MEQDGAVWSFLPKMPDAVTIAWRRSGVKKCGAPNKGHRVRDQRQHDTICEDTMRENDRRSRPPK